MRIVRDSRAQKSTGRYKGKCKVSKPLGKHHSWGYKRHVRYVQVGFDNLDDQQHTGRPLKVGRVIMKKIRKNVCKKIVWAGKEMQGHILENMGMIYPLTHVRYLIRQWDYSQKVLVGVYANRASAEEIYMFQKEIADVIKKRREENSHRNTGRIHSDCRTAGMKTWLHQNGNTCVLRIHGLALKDHSVWTAYHRRQEDIQTVRQV